MKKIFFLVTIIAVMVTCMVACGNNDSIAESGVNTGPIEENVIIHELPPKLSNEFIKTALQFIDEYSTPSKELENLSVEIIQQSASFRDNLYTYLNSYLTDEYDPELIQQSLGIGYDNVKTVKVFIHNYKVGGNVGCASFNHQEPFYNYEHDKYILAAGIVGENYPDDVTLAQARIASYILTQMLQADVEAACIITNSEGKKSYDFTFNNEAFKETAKEVLQNLIES